MACMKCGRPTEDTQAFCPECLDVMARYPVKKDIAVHIPKRKVAMDRLAQQWENPSQKALQQQRLTIRILTAGIILLSLLLCVTAGMLVYTLQNPATPPSVSASKQP